LYEAYRILFWNVFHAAAFLFQIFLKINSYDGGREMYEEELVALLIEKKLKISTAESCTGGLVAGKIINAAGASAVYSEGFITYADEAKIKYLGVKKSTLETYGAVSRQTVYEMAQGCAEQSSADVTVVTSGVAGPAGGTKETPVGLVWFACFYNGEVIVKKEIFPGSRMEIRTAAADYAVKLVLNVIKN